MDPPLRTLLEPEARRPRGPSSHRRRRSRQVRQARRIPRARQEEEEVNATTSPTEASYAVVSDTDTVRLQRTLPGPIERVWQYITDAGLRRQWLAGGDDVQPRAGTSFEMVWRNDALTAPPRERPESFGGRPRHPRRGLDSGPPPRLPPT